MLNILQHARIEVYCGKKQHEGTVLDDHSGATAVLRNLNAVLPKVSDEWHAVATDRFYTSVQLALQLLHRHVYTAGTVVVMRSIGQRLSSPIAGLCPVLLS